jgi:hypothetical protein
MRALQNTINNYNFSNIEKELEEGMFMCLSKTKDEYTLQEVIDHLRPNECDECDIECGYDCGECGISLHIEKGSYWTTIHLDEDHSTNAVNCDWKISVDSDGRLRSVTEYDKELSRGRRISFEGELETLLMNMFARRSKIIIDSTDPDDYELGVKEED